MSRQNNLELHLGCHTCWLSCLTLTCLWCGRTDVRSRDYKSPPKFLGCINNQIFLPMVRCFARFARARAPLIILKFIKLPEVSPSNWNQSSLRFTLPWFLSFISLKWTLKSVWEMETTINLQERISEFAVKKEKEAGNQERYYKKKIINTT